MKKIIYQSFLICFLLLLWALTFNAFSKNGVPFWAHEEDFRIRPKTNQIDLSNAQKFYNDGFAVFIDCRDAVSYNNGHIPNALSLPSHKLNELLPDFLGQLEPEDDIVTYCDGSECDASVVVANRLKSAGFRNVYIFFGGWNAWIEANLPVE